MEGEIIKSFEGQGRTNENFLKIFDRLEQRIEWNENHISKLYAEIDSLRRRLND